MQKIDFKNFSIANHLPFCLIAGPCQMESRTHALASAEAIKTITDRFGIPLIYKSSFDKANRTSLKGQRGLGQEKCLPIFEEIKKQFDIPVITDIHEPQQAAEVGAIVDILQIPAFLCRQTDLLIAAAKTGRIINVKKGQFLAPWDIPHVIQKISESGNEKIILTDRGTSFGYNNLVSDIRSFPIMKKTGYPVCVDATHSIQQPGRLGTQSGGDASLAPYIARAAISAGIAAVFMEVHEDPERAPSDAKSMLPLSQLSSVLSVLKAIDHVVKI